MARFGRSARRWVVETDAHMARKGRGTRRMEGTQGSMGEIGESPFFDAIEIVVGMVGSHPGVKARTTPMPRLISIERGRDVGGER